MAIEAIHYVTWLAKEQFTPIDSELRQIIGT